MAKGDLVLYPPSVFAAMAPLLERAGRTEKGSITAFYLNLPSYYGMNADALNDCLSGRSAPVRLWIASRGEGEVARTLDLICRVVRDNGGTVKEL